jgi:hypothetical protein
MVLSQSKAIWCPVPIVWKEVKDAFEETQLSPPPCACRREERGKGRRESVKEEGDKALSNPLSSFPSKRWPSSISTRHKPEPVSLSHAHNSQGAWTLTRCMVRGEGGRKEKDREDDKSWSCVNVDSAKSSSVRWWDLGLVWMPSQGRREEVGSTLA